MNRRKFIQAMGQATGALWSGRLLGHPVPDGRWREPLPPASLAAAVGGEAFRPFFFIQTSDTHAGFSANGAEGMPLFSQILDRAGRLEAPFVAVTGDLINDGLDPSLRPIQQAILDKVLAASKVPVKLMPGNHDIGNAYSRQAYLDHYGPDFYSFTVNNCEFIALDSNTLRDSPAFVLEYEEQMAWLNEALENATRARRSAIFTMHHHPPYGYAEDEGNSYYNFWQTERSAYLNLLRRHEVDYVLAGHIHATAVLGTAAPPIVTVGGANFDYDGRGLGFRVFRVLRDGVKHFFVRLDQPVTTPPEAPAQPVVGARTPATLTIGWPEPASAVGIVRYLVTRDGVELGYTAEESYTDAGLEPGSSHTYTVTAYDAANTPSPASIPLTATTRTEARSAARRWTVYQ